MSFLNEWWFVYIVLPALIFLSRLVDVSLDTMRVIFLNRGRKIIAPILGFFQVLIWVMAISQVMKNLSNPICYIAYAGGFAAGNLLGMLIEEKVAAGWLAVRIITQKSADELVAALLAEGYGATILDARSAEGPVNVVFIVIRRKHFPRVVEYVKQHNPQAFYSTQEVRSVTGGIMAAADPTWPLLPRLRWGKPTDR